MASGKKNYFRHSFFARNDIKLRLLRDKIGVGFYFYYFSLLEQCGEFSSDFLSDDYEFHDSIIRNLWGVNLKKSERVANELHAVGLLFFEKREKTFYFRIDNFAKYLGKYQTKVEPNTPNKRKEKKRKEKEKKENKNVTNFSSDVIDYLNKKTGKNFKSGTSATDSIILARKKEGFNLEDFKFVIDNKIAEWGSDEKMKKYIRPSTLFGTKFDSYRQESKLETISSLFNSDDKHVNDINLDDVFKIVGGDCE